MRYIQWFARTEHFARIGPYPSQVDAWRALRGHDGNPVPEATVWCEEVPDDDDDERKGARAQ